MTYLLIDLSYYTFYRIFALLNWFGHAHPECELSKEEIVNSEIFKTKIQKMFTQKLKELIKKYKIEPDKCILAKDCSRSQIWRNDHIDKYKDGRANNIPGSIFKYIYSEVLPETLTELGIKLISNDRTEADDIVYITKEYIRSNSSDSIIIIANDHDYLQLIDENTKIYNLQNKCLNDKSCGDPKKDLLTKIIMGDKSDNIDKVFPKCGKKTMEKYLSDNKLLENDLNKDQKYIDKFNQNKLVIDFTMIPKEIISSVNKKLEEIMK